MTNTNVKSLQSQIDSMGRYALMGAVLVLLFVVEERDTGLLYLAVWTITGLVTVRLAMLLVQQAVHAVRERRNA